MRVNRAAWRVTPAVPPPQRTWTGCYPEKVKQEVVNFHLESLRRDGAAWRGVAGRGGAASVTPGLWAGHGQPAAGGASSDEPRWKCENPGEKNVSVLKEESLPNGAGRAEVMSAPPPAPPRPRPAPRRPAGPARESQGSRQGRLCEAQRRRHGTALLARRRQVAHHSNVYITR